MIQRRLENAATCAAGQDEYLQSDACFHVCNPETIKDAKSKGEFYFLLFLWIISARMLEI